MPKITVRINKKTGVMQVGTTGVTGEGCLLLTKPLRDGLGITEEPDKTSDYYAQDNTNEGQQEQGN